MTARRLHVQLYFRASWWGSLWGIIPGPWGGLIRPYHSPFVFLAQCPGTGEGPAAAPGGGPASQ